MGSSARNYLITFLIYVSVLNEIDLPVVKCQDEEADQCLPRKTFFALLRLPEVSSNLAAYSRTARIIQDAKNRNEIVNLKSLSSEDADDTEICLPVGVYLNLFSDPAMRGHLSAIGRAQKMFEDPTTRTYVTNEDLAEAEEEEAEDEEDDELRSEKRSLATLAKNGDLPISIQEKTDEEDEEEKRSLASLVHERSGPITREELEALINYSELNKRNIAALARDYGLPLSGKRNVASLARDFALPPTNSGKRNVAALARDFALPSGKRNVAALARDFALPSGKRNVAALARDFALPSGKRNVAALARDYGLPYGKRYIDIFSRGSATKYQPFGDKRNYAALVKNGDLPNGLKRNIAALARDGSSPQLYRFGRSLETVENKLKESEKKIEDHRVSRDDEDVNEKKLEALANSGSRVVDHDKSTIKEHGDKNNDDYSKNNKLTKKIIGEKRTKRQIDFSDEYPLPVMQNTNVLEYEDLIDALTAEYPNTEKRFMAADPAMDVGETAEDGFYLSPAPPKRHIAALARLGWLPSFRAARFSRSPRYLVNREDSADGTSADNPTDSSSRTLGISGRINRYNTRSSNFGDCRHGFKRFIVVPRTVDKLLLHKLYTTQRNL